MYVCDQDGYRTAEFAVNLPNGAPGTLVCEQHKDAGASYVLRRWGVSEVGFSRIARTEKASSGESRG